MEDLVRAPSPSGLASAQMIEAEIQRRLSPGPRKPASIDDDLHRLSLQRVPRIECGDGLTMSVQASYAHYCTPRDSFGPWTTVEVGFPTRRIEAFMPYIDGGKDTDPTDTVYGYVPLGIVAQAVAEAGGLMPEKTYDRSAEAHGTAREPNQQPTTSSPESASAAPGGSGEQ